jgi:telomere length regulation protein
LLDNKGVSQILAEFTCCNKHGNDVLKPDKTMLVSRVAQLLASVPDKARLGASGALASTYPFPLYGVSYTLLDS